MEGIERRVDLAQRVAKLFIFGMRGIKPQRDADLMELLRFGPGGVFLFDQNMESQAQTRNLIAEIRDMSPHDLLLAVDQEGGKASNVPGLRGKDARNLELPEIHAQAIRFGVALRELGFDVNLAPVADVGFGAGIGVRSFGDVPGVVANKTAIAVTGYRRAQIMCCIKHFPGYGQAKVDAHWGLPTINNTDLGSFYKGVAAGAPFVMMGHVVCTMRGWPQIPASLSAHAHYVLRHSLGFTGAIMSDDLSMYGAKGFQDIGVGEAAIRAVEAGADIMIVTWPEERVVAFEAVMEAVQSGRISEDRLLEANMNVALLPRISKVTA